MPIYYGHPAVQSNRRRVEISRALKEQGIELLRAVPSQVHTFVIPYVENPLWASFICSLSALLFSLSTSNPVSLNLGGYRIDSKHENPLPIRLPDLCIQVTNPGPRTHQWLIDAGYEEQEIRGVQYYLLINPKASDINELIGEDCPVNFKEANYTPLRFANLSAIFVFSEMVNILTYLLQAFSASLWAGTVDRRDLIPSQDKLGDASKEDTAMYDPLAMPSTSPDMSSGTEEHTLTSLFSVPAALPMFPSKKLVVDAAPLSHCRAWTTPSIISEIENIGHGVFARFVPELSDDDQFGVPNFFSKFLRRSLGNSASEILETIERFRSAWGILKSTSSGHILSHIVKSIEICIEAHIAPTAIFDQEFYEGMVMNGLGFVISLRTGTFAALSPEDLQKEIQLLETHRKAIDSLKDFLKQGKVIVSGELDNMNDIRKSLLQGKFSETQRDEIRKLVKKLRFPVRKWSINIGTIMTLLNTITTGTDAINDDFPIGPEGIFSDDPTEVAMSCFASNGCPSFRHPSGVPVDLRSSKPPTPPTEIRRKGGRGPQQVNNGGWIFSIRRVDYNEAVSDFRIMTQQGEARSMSSSAARGLGYFVVSGGNFEKVFMKLKECLKLTVPSGSERAGEIDREDGGVQLKRALETDVPGGVDKRPRRFFM